MDKQYILDAAKRQVSAPAIQESLKTYGRPLFYSVGGSHNAGFPIPGSDLDIRAVYLAPSERFFRLRSQTLEPSFDHISHDRKFDIVAEEVGKFLDQIARSNGERIEWINSQLVFNTSEEFSELKDLVNSAGISKNLAKYYQAFARTILSGKTEMEGVKRYLHASGKYMTGIVVLETGKVISDINLLNQKFGYDIIPQMITARQNPHSEDYDIKKAKTIIKELDQKIEIVARKSKLQDKPNRIAIDQYLVNLRTANLKAISDSA